MTRASEVAPDTGVEVLVVRAAGMRIALPLDCVREVLRPLPVKALDGLPPWAPGVAVLRGEGAAVVDLAHLLGGEPGRVAQRWVSVQFSGRRVALLVDGVLGVQGVSATRFAAAEGVLRGAAGDVVRELAVRDGALHATLDGARLLHDEWAAVEAACAEDGT